MCSAATDVVQVRSVFEGETPHIFGLSGLNQVAADRAHQCLDVPFCGSIVFRCVRRAKVPPNGRLASATFVQVIAEGFVGEFRPVVPLTHADLMLVAQDYFAVELFECFEGVRLGHQEVHPHAARVVIYEYYCVLLSMDRFRVAGECVAVYYLEWFR